MKKFLLAQLILCLSLSTVFAQIELVSNGTLEDTLMAPWGAYAASAANVESFRVDSQYYEGTHAARIWDHTWGVFLWNDCAGFSDSATYDVSFWYKGDEPMKFTLAISRDLGYDLVTDEDNIVPEGATVEKVTVDNGGIKWPLPATGTWTKFTYSFGFTDWLGTDPETGEKIVAQCSFMFENTSYAVDDGPSSYVDNVSIIKTDMPGTTAIHKTLASEVRVFPNPATDMIRFMGIDNASTAKLFNITGRLVKNVQLHSTNTLDISDLPAGLYTISIFTHGGKNITSKFIKK